MDEKENKMNSYMLIILADILLAVTFACQKKYQEKAGLSVKASLVYTILSGFFSAMIFLVINRFNVRVTLFSIIMAVVVSVVITIYVFIGFRIMKTGSLSIYTLFLMSGGMIVPYIYGVLFLNEELSFARILGLMLIMVAIVVANFSRDKFDVKQLALCVGVFLLNGAVGVITKTHQISDASVTACDFVFLVFLSKIVVSILALFFKKGRSSTKINVPIKSVILIIFVSAVADGISYMLQLVGAVNLPATVLYPLITGGTIILSSLVDFIIYKERLSLRQCIGTGIAFLGTLMFL